MSRTAQRLAALGLVLPAPLKVPPGVVLPFEFVRVSGTRAFVSGHGPTLADGSLAGPFGKVGREVTPAQAHESARLTALAILGSLQRTLGNLDRITAWTRVFGMVNSAPGFTGQPGVVNGASELLGEVFGDAGRHARSAVGVAVLPLDAPVEVELIVEVAD